jgi:hypothetical protein
MCGKVSVLAFDAHHPSTNAAQSWHRTSEYNPLVAAPSPGTAIPRQHVLCSQIIRFEDDRPRFTDPFARVDASGRAGRSAFGPQVF